MKPWIIVLLVGVGGYAAYSYYHKQRSSAAGQNAANAGKNTSWLNSLFGTGDLSSSPLVSGVPIFNQTAVLNKPDQLAASAHTNDMSTIDGSGVYMPAFGPQENQPVFGESSVW